MARKTTQKAPAAAGKNKTTGAAEAAALPGKNEAAKEPEPPAATDTGPDRATGGKATVTMDELAEAYLKGLEEAGKSRGTVFGYSIDLALAVRHFGEKAKLSGLTQKKITAYFESDAVTKTRSGKPKAKPTIDKARRVLRLALVWAAEQGWIAAAPIPEAYRRRRSGTKKAQQQ